MHNNKKIFIFTILISIILVGVIGGFSLFAFNNINRFTTYQDNTTVANVYVGGLYGNEARKEITTEALNWKRSADIQLNYQGYKINIETDVVSFDINTSINEIKNEQDNPLYVAISDGYLETLINDHQTNLKYNQFDIERLERDLINLIDNLYYNIKIDLGLYVTNFDDNKTVLNSAILNHVNQALDLSIKYNTLVNQIEIKPKSHFSLLDLNTILSETEANEFTDYELSVIATAMYELIMKSNFNDIQKHTTKNIENYPTYAEDKKGFEAIINQKLGLNLSFYNPNSTPYYITLIFDQNHLQFDLLGLPFVNTIEVIGATSDLIISIPPEEIVLFKENYNGVTVNEPIIFPGKAGFVALIERKITDTEGDTFIQTINEDICMPKDTIIIKKLS